MKIYRSQLTTFVLFFFVFLIVINNDNKATQNSDRSFKVTPTKLLYFMNNDSLVVERNKINILPYGLDVFMPSCRDNRGPSKTQIQSLAIYMGLMENNTRKLNRHLDYKIGDISFWYEQELDLKTLYFEFLSRKILLEKAESEGFYIRTMGDLSWAAERTIFFIKDESDAQKEFQAIINSVKKLNCLMEIVIAGKFLVISKENLEEVLAICKTIPETTSIMGIAEKLDISKIKGINSHLSMQDGDYAFWREQGLNFRNYLVEFAARRLILEAATLQKVYIPEQGDLSFSANQVKEKISNRL